MVEDIVPVTKYTISTLSEAEIARHLTFLLWKKYTRQGLIFFFERTFKLVSVKPIHYACTVKNDTPLICTVGVKVQMGFG